MTDAKYSKVPDLNTKVSEWRTLFDRATLRPEKEGLATRLNEVEAATFARIQELSQPGATSSEQELCEIRDANRIPKDLRRELLGFPDWDDHGQEGDAS
jgi:hypothetical protein